MTSDAEEEPMTLLAERKVHSYEVSARLPAGPLIAADLDDIELDLPFEIADGALVLMPPPSPWHDLTADRIRQYLRPRYPHVGEDLQVLIGDHLRRPDVVGLSIPTKELVDADHSTLAVDLVIVAVEVISHDPNPAKDRISVGNDRTKKFIEYAAAGISEYWIADRMPGDPEDAWIEIFRLDAAAYRPVRMVRLSELLAEGGPEKTA
jgi:Uma2 family endonuclease